MLKGIIHGFILFAMYATSVFLFNRMLDSSSPVDIAGFAISFCLVYGVHLVCGGEIYKRWDKK